MGKHGVPISRKLILALADNGGNLTLTQVARRLRGRLSEAARKETAGLVDFTRSHSKATQRPTWKLSLTTLGVAYAQSLKIGWKPARLSIADWLAQLAEMTAERVPAALQIARDRQDALVFRKQEAERKAADRAREKAAAERARKPKVKRGQSEWFKQNVLNDEPELFPNVRTENVNEPALRIPSFDPIAKVSHYQRTSVEYAANRTTVPNATSTVKPAASVMLGGVCENCYADSERCTCPNPQHRHVPFKPITGPPPVPNTHAQSDPEIARIGKMIRDAGYGDAIVSPGRVLFNCKEISFQQWAKEHGLA